MVDLLGQSVSTNQQMFSVDAFTGLLEFRPGFAPRRRLRQLWCSFTGTRQLIHGWPEAAIPAIPEAGALFNRIFSL